MRLTRTDTNKTLNIKSLETLTAIIKNLKSIERLESGKVAYQLKGYNFRLIGSIKTLLEFNRIDTLNKMKGGF